MEWSDTHLLVALGVILRLGIPIVLTALFAGMLRRLDARWQREAEMERKSNTLLPVKNQKPCYEIKGCSEENRSQCQAVNANSPCWQIFRQPNGYLQENCLTCIVFSGAAA